jgi:hypothetical protein
MLAVTTAAVTMEMEEILAVVTVAPVLEAVACLRVEGAAEAADHLAHFSAAGATRWMPPKEALCTTAIVWPVGLVICRKQALIHVTARQAHQLAA